MARGADASRGGDPRAPQPRRDRRALTPAPARSPRRDAQGASYLGGGGGWAAGSSGRGARGAEQGRGRGGRGPGREAHGARAPLARPPGARPLRHICSSGREGGRGGPAVRGCLRGRDGGRAGGGRIEAAGGGLGGRGGGRGGGARGAASTPPLARSLAPALPAKPLSPLRPQARGASCQAGRARRGRGRREPALGRGRGKGGRRGRGERAPGGRGEGGKGGAEPPPSRARPPRPHPHAPPRGPAPGSRAALGHSRELAWGGRGSLRCPALGEARGGGRARGPRGKAPKTGKMEEVAAAEQAGTPRLLLRGHLGQAPLRPWAAEKAAGMPLCGP